MVTALLGAARAALDAPGSGSHSPCRRGDRADHTRKTPSRCTARHRGADRLVGLFLHRPAAAPAISLFRAGTGNPLGRHPAGDDVPVLSQSPRRRSRRPRGHLPRSARSSAPPPLGLTSAVAAPFSNRRGAWLMPRASTGIRGHRPNVLTSRFQRTKENDDEKRSHSITNESALVARRRGNGLGRAAARSPRTRRGGGRSSRGLHGRDGRANRQHQDRPRHHVGADRRHSWSSS